MRPSFLAAAVVVAATLSGCGTLHPAQPAGATTPELPSPTPSAEQTFAEPLAAGVPGAFGWDGIDGAMMMCFPIHSDYPDRSVWTFDGTTWKATPAPTRSALGPAMLAYDVQRNRMVLIESDPMHQTYTWEWNGQFWRRAVTAHVPRVFSQTASAAYSPELHAVVVFEASMDAQPTYLYDGTDWRAIATPHVPTVLARMVYDPKRHLIVGLTDTDFRTWLFDGVDWTRLAVEPPVSSASSARIEPITPNLGNMGRQGPAIALDEATDQWVVFGGYDAQNFFFDTWVGDGRSWTKLSPSTAPQPRSGIPGSVYLAWDSALSRLVLFGGMSKFQGGYLSDTWTWDGASWSRLS